jgi:hypothetical protein
MGKKSSDSKAANKLAKKEKQATKVKSTSFRTGRQIGLAHPIASNMVDRAPKPRKSSQERERGKRRILRRSWRR